MGSRVLFFALCSLFLLRSSTICAQESGGNATALVSTAESPEVQDAHARVLHAQVLQMFQDGQLGASDALAQQLRSGRLRFRGGAWQLNALYGAIDTPGSMTETDASWQAFIKKLQDWSATEPGSPTPQVALARAYLTFAWKARGNGYANSVTQQGWELFRQRVQSARSTLERTEKVSVDCPEWYRAMQTVALAQAWPREQVDALVQDALAHHPDYYYFAEAEANYLLPKWYGRPGETEAFAAQTADRVGGPEGDALYFQIAAHINCCKMTQAPAMDEARIQKAFLALEQLYGSTNRQRNEAAFLALRAGDRSTAQTLFSKIGNDWSEAVWRSKARFDASRTGQPLGGVEPVGQAGTSSENGR